MKIDDVLALTKAGFSKDEILKMTGVQTTTQQTATQQTATQQTATQQTATQQTTTNESLLNAIQSLTATLQASNIQNTGAQSQQNKPETADQIAQRMMEIMN